MHPRYPWTASCSTDAEKVGLFSIGSLEEKIPFVLYPLLLSSDIALVVHKIQDFPGDLTSDLTDKIKTSLQKDNVKNIIFDLRIRRWTNTRHFERARLLSRSLKDNCDELGINSSIILSNGDRLIGNTLGTYFEMMEAENARRGKGPLDLTKYALEIGTDILMMTNKARQRLDAKKWLRDRIINSASTEDENKTNPPSPPFLYTTKQIRLAPSQYGYVHRLDMDMLHSLKSEPASHHPGIGFSFLKKTGDRIDPGNDVVEVFLQEGKNIPFEADIFRKMFAISSTPPDYQPFILERF